MRSEPLLWALATGAALIYWRLSLGEGQGWGRSLIKGLAVAPLALLALWQGAPYVALALALCSLGDVILSRPGEGAFLGGLVAFAAGHLGWIAVFFGVFEVAPGRLSEPPVLGLALTLLILAGATALRILPKAGSLWVPVLIYICIILVMGLAGLLTGVAAVMAGILLFAASDSLLGLQKFALLPGSPAERWANGAIWPLYWGAVALLTLAALGTV